MEVDRAEVDGMWHLGFMEDPLWLSNCVWGEDSLRGGRIRELALRLRVEGMKRLLLCNIKTKLRTNTIKINNHAMHQ